MDAILVAFAVVVVDAGLVLWVLAKEVDEAAAAEAAVLEVVASTGKFVNDDGAILEIDAVLDKNDDVFVDTEK